MKYLLDSHILLWYMEGNKKLKKRYIDIINDEKNEIFVSAVTLWEIALKFSIGKLELIGSFSDFVAYINENDFQLLPYDEDDLNEMILLPFHHQDPFDRVIIAQSISKKLPLLSNDDKFSLYDVDLV